MNRDAEISLRKLDHLRICTQEEVDFRKTNGFEGYEFEQMALPEADFDEIDLSTRFLDHDFALPFFIEALTGGAAGTEKINRNLAEAAQAVKIGLGLGSQRAMLLDPGWTYTYQVRDVAPDIFLLGNLGGAQLAKCGPDQVAGLVRDVGADGMAIHLNPLQELIQPEGDRDWRGFLEALEKLCREAHFPVVVKEVGHGISGPMAARLEAAGVAAIDVAGAGGTSFARVEYYRGGETAKAFFEWGIPTAASLRACRKAVSIPLVASGGIRNGVECAKALAMGAGLVGFGRPLLLAALDSPGKVIQEISRLAGELKTAMLLVGTRNIRELQQRSLVARMT
ncbi:MAG: type 2 isopentenyl-diphosphate Delta-isomerase [Thermodesulfobacteriota bacterium]